MSWRMYRLLRLGGRGTTPIGGNLGIKSLGHVTFRGFGVFESKQPKYSFLVDINRYTD